MAIVTEIIAVMLPDPVPAPRLRWCPVDGKPLTSRQTVCSARCRAVQWRQRQEEARERRIAQIPALLEAALRKASEP